jgi:hypothetical protein
MGRRCAPCRSTSPPKNSPSPRKRAGAMAYQEGERALKMENPTTRGPIESAAKRYAMLAEKLEAARESSTSP